MAFTYSVDWQSLVAVGGWAGLSSSQNPPPFQTSESLVTTLLERQVCPGSFPSSFCSSHQMRTAWYISEKSRHPLSHRTERMCVQSAHPSLAPSLCVTGLWCAPAAELHLGTGCLHKNLVRSHHSVSIHRDCSLLSLRHQLITFIPVQHLSQVNRSSPVPWDREKLSHRGGGRGQVLLVIFGCWNQA